MFTFVNLWELSKHTLFDDITLPSGTYMATLPDGSYETRTITPDKDVLINSIFDEVAELQPLTIDVDVMKMKINNFFLRNQENFSRLIAINLITYSPIENTDKFETRTNKYDGKTVDEDKETGGDTDILQRKVSSFESNDLNIAGQDTNTNTRNIFNNRNKKIDDTTNETVHAHGNIGVTTNQQMLNQEIDFWNKFNFYKIVANKFMFELCLTIETY